MFYAGGVVDPAAEMKEPIYTGLLINWTSVLFFVTIISTMLFAVLAIFDVVEDKR